MAVIAGLQVSLATDPSWQLMLEPWTVVSHAQKKCLITNPKSTGKDYGCQATSSKKENIKKEIIKNANKSFTS